MARSWEDHFYAEIVNPDTGEPVADGEPGELVFTSLTKEAMPIIRYRTRDLTRLLPPTARSMRRIGKITGRSDDMLIVRGVNLFPTQVEELVLKIAQLAPHYQLVLSRSGNLDELEILTEVRAEFSTRPRPSAPAWASSCSMRSSHTSASAPACRLPTRASSSVP